MRGKHLKQGQKKGFVITLDGTAALLIIFIALLLVYTQNFQLNAPRGIYLKQISLDVLDTLEKSGRIQKAVDLNSSAVREVLEATPESVCMDISINDELGTEIATLPKTNCSSSGRELQVVTKAFIKDGNNYRATAESWYKK
ncbi:hypothetical protein HZC07_02485 [Candidatus Micrarchaeota archaeon]|nr:hypothetical protein [Candidatus Micrarchaeota archaeon]